MIDRVRAAVLRFWPLLALLGLPACATSTGCDPARAGFVESLNCSNGGFQGRQAYLEQNLAASRANALEQQADAARAGAAADAAQQDLAERRYQLARLDVRLAEMRARLASAESQAGPNKAAIRQASVELNDLAFRQSHISHENPAAAELRTIEERQTRMMHILNDL